MDVMHEHVGGLDVHKETVVACVRVQSGGKPSRQCETFDTTTAGLLALLAWLKASGCTQVAMEATGVYWKPVWAILSDGDFELVLANAAHIKNVPGRKTDVNDAMWIADLLACGLIRPSFVPDAPMQDLRALLRTRTQLVREQTRHTQRIHKTLEAANIKLASVVSDIMGTSGRRMIDAMIAGQRNPARRRTRRPAAEGHPQGQTRLGEIGLFRRDQLAKEFAIGDSVGADTAVAEIADQQCFGETAERRRCC
jgi:transposase